MNEQLRQRMGVVIVGPSGAGKSTLWRMLRAALSKTDKVVSKRQTAYLDFHSSIQTVHIFKMLSYLDIKQHEKHLFESLWVS